MDYLQFSYLTDIRGSKTSQFSDSSPLLWEPQIVFSELTLWHQLLPTGCTQYDAYSTKV
jgi:hypothetical protein